MEIIDQSQWKRKEIFDFFSNISNPFYMVTFNVDVTNVYNFSKKNGLSFYYLLIYLINESLNRIENFRYTIRNNEVILLDRREPSFTVLDNESELFKMITMTAGSDVFEFDKRAKQKASAQKSLVDLSEETDELYYFSCLPWIELTALTNEMNLNDPKMKDDSIPRIAWGKYVENNGCKSLGLSMEVNHRFVDGVHIGKFAKELEKAINAL